VAWRFCCYTAGQISSYRGLNVTEVSAVIASASSGLLIRKAEDCRVRMDHQAGQAHRSAAGWTIDYRLQEATGGEARAISTISGQFIDKPAFSSPWHHHDCALQVAIVLQGSIELAFEAERFVRAGKGDVLFIPGQVPHNVSAPSADYQVAEITFPGTFGTTETMAPAPDHVTRARILPVASALRCGTEGGVARYVYPVAEPYARHFALSRLVRLRTDPFIPSTWQLEAGFALTLVTQGWCEISLDGKTIRAGVGDLLIVPGGCAQQETALSDDYQAVEVQLLK
jgi:quercetin dioxygenase-like cupin family protein